MQKTRSFEFTHDLESLLATAEKVGLAVSTEDREVIALVNSNYVLKQLEYFEAGARNYPTYGILEERVSQLLRQILVRHSQRSPPLRL